MARTRLILGCSVGLLLASACNTGSDDSAAAGAAGIGGVGGIGGDAGGFSGSGGSGGASGSGSGAAGIGGAGGIGGAAGIGGAGGFGGAAGIGGFGDAGVAGDIGGSGGDLAGSGGGGDNETGSLTAGTWDDNVNFERFTEYRSELLQDPLLGAGVLQTLDSDHVAAHERFAEIGAAHARLDIALVIDTTGSMGDEIRYLQSEVAAISQTIAARYPDAEQLWGLVVYRDVGDEYLTRSFGLSSDNAQFRSHLDAQQVGGGGDFPEAPEAGLAAANAFQWRAGDDVARLIFWVADAPHHAEHRDAMADAIFGAQDAGVHVYPIASSGVDELTELTMRSAAQLTGGRYLFLTDDSGIGGEHKEPTIPCYFVTKLSVAMLRMVDIEMTGEHVDPNPDDVIRTGGNPEDSQCTLEDGELVAIF